MTRHRRWAQAVPTILICSAMLFSARHGATAAVTWPIGWSSPAIITTSAGANDVTFSKAETGWAVGNGGALFTTVNGGRRWIERHLGSTEVIQGIPVADSLMHVAFSDAQDGYVAGQSTLWQTRDGGLHWRQVPIPRGAGLLQEIATPQPMSIYAAVGNGATTGIYASSTGGVTWHLTEPFPANNGMTLVSAMAFPSDTSGWIATNTGLLHTTDGGSTWRVVRSGDYSALSFPTGNTGYIAHGLTIDQTHDGGITWSRSAFRAVPLAPSDIGAIGSAVGVIRYFVSQVHFVSSSRGIVATDRGDIYNTTDGGSTWHRVPLPRSLSLGSASTVVPVVGGLIGFDGTVPYVVLRAGMDATTGVFVTLPR